MGKQRIPRQPRSCKFCEKPFTVKPSYLKRNGKSAEFCSHTCYVKYIKSPAYFWSLVKKNGEACWLWIGRLTKGGTGYGQVRFNRRCQNASRVAYELTYGPLPANVVVRHKCDNPPCCNPDHLLPGTNANNSSDMVERGRQMKGEDHHFAKVTTEIVRAIRQDYRPRKFPLHILAQRYDVSIATVHKIAMRQTWKHVD